jgi:hypothetical protein
MLSFMYKTVQNKGHGFSKVISVPGSPGNPQKEIKSQTDEVTGTRQQGNFVSPLLEG